MTREKGVMPWAIFKKIIDDCRSFPYKRLRLFFHLMGEPIFDPLLFQRIDYAARNLPEAKICFNTNASLLTPKISKMILESPLSEIIFSVDSTQSTTYEQIRQGLSYKTTVDNLNNFFELKKRQPRRLKAIMQMVVSSRNRREIKQYKTLWKEKADQVSIKPMNAFLDAGLSERTSILTKRQVGFCLQPFYYLVVYWNGDIGLCHWDYDNIASIGNIQDESLYTNYNNQKAMARRMAMCRMDCGNCVPCNRCSQIYGYDRTVAWLFIK
ncbi:MAG: SPASM domain-containing protein [Candidatus Omnitrophica bacterium]|nr:SPASM domain-containing protein [Candidatus Omnitrophota bacterium]